MRVDTNLFGTVPMPDAGDPSIAPTDRRYGQADVLACYDNMLHWAQTADRVGFDTMWLAEHHFQYEGYEVLPNLIMFGVHAASITDELRYGQMFNVVPQWHPLRLAEDYALATIFTNGRMQFGAGRGTVPREAQSLGTVVASGDNEMAESMDQLNREVFEESMEIILAAWNNESFSFRGKHFVLPPDGIPDRGDYVKDLTLVPKPLAPVDVYQPVTSPRTMEYVPRMGFRAVYWQMHPDHQKRYWDDYAERRAEAGNPVASPGADRVLVLCCHVAATREEAIARVRTGHDEFAAFLAPYGRFRNYKMPDGSAPPFGYQPTLEESMANRIWAVGSPDDVAEVIGEYRDLLGLEHICLFFDAPGLSREEIDEQYERVASEVMPRLGESLQRPRP